MDLPELSRFELTSLFRFGFIAYPAAEEPEGDSVWRAMLPHWHACDVAGIRLRWHPQTRLSVAPSLTGATVAVGEVFPLGAKTVEDVLATLGSEEAGSTQYRAIDELGGRFAILLVSPERIVVLNDAFGARSVFYRTQGCMGIASHAALLAHAFGIARRADIALFMKSQLYSERSVKYLPGHATVYQDVWALIPNHALDALAGEQFRYWPRTARGVSTLEKFSDHCLQHLAALVGYCKSAGRIPVVGITGGIDSRVLVGAFSAGRVEFRGVTWRGGYLRDEEVETVDAIRRRLGLSYVEFDPAHIKAGAAASAAYRNSGNFRGPSRLVEGMHLHFADAAQAIFVRGYGGEILRGFYNLFSSRVDGLAIADMARLYGIRASSAEATASAYATVGAQCFAAFHQVGEFEHIGDLGFDPLDIFYWEHRMGMWGSAMLNEMDAAMYSLVGFNSRPLYEAAFGLPNGQRLTKDLLKTIVAKFDPWLANLPCT